MTAKGSLVESIYKAIKLEVTSGQLLPGHRVDIASLCSRFGVSKSPVRNILNRLVGEGLLEPHAHDGFYRPFLTEQKLRDLYQWSQDILLLSIARIDLGAAPIPVPQTDANTSTDWVTQTEVLFITLAAQSGNAEYRQAMDNANARLRPIRRQTPADMFDVAAELTELNGAISTCDRQELSAALEAYHARRFASVAKIVATAYR
jgi:DNA-binding GntR family transcriptional regulator